MTEDAIRLAVKKGTNINWDYICWKQKLSEDFIRDFSNEVKWVYISYHQILSENFIKEFADKVDWFCVSDRQKISNKFIQEFSDKIHFKHVPLCFFKIKKEYSWKTFL